mmetsp:Transcript_37389/g.106818  ORF Transcript_37389/g.106818 Transcript_37389/m.106818 type:complete len:202 (-) Transcript_37389:967-1572(-)
MRRGGHELRAAELCQPLVRGSPCLDPPIVPVEHPVQRLHPRLQKLLLGLAETQPLKAGLVHEAVPAVCNPAGARGLRAEERCVGRPWARQAAASRRFGERVIWAPERPYGALLWELLRLQAAWGGGLVDGTLAPEVLWKVARAVVCGHRPRAAVWRSLCPQRAQTDRLPVGNLEDCIALLFVAIKSLPVGHDVCWTKARPV